MLMQCSPAARMHRGFLVAYAVRTMSSKNLKRPTTPLGMLAWDAAEEAAKNAEDGLQPHELAESVLERVANRKIRESIANGDFDNLQGSGKSIRDYDSGTDSGLNKMLKNANIKPKWIEDGQLIRKDLREFRSNHTVRTLKELNSLNSRVQAYNLICELPTMVIPMLRPAEDLK